MMTVERAPDVGRAAERSALVHTLAGLAVVFLVLSGMGVWAAQTEISGAVVSSGIVVVESRVKKVQHPTGGVVSDNQLRRDAMRLEGEKGHLESAAAQAKGRIAEIQVEVLRIDQEFRTSIIQELRDNRAQQAELVERRIAAEDQLKRIEILAPQAGIVHELAVHTVGGVINPAEPIMLIVPEGDDLLVEARIATHDIEQVINGDKTAFVRFSAFDYQTTPELTGHVHSVAADLTIDQLTGLPYILARISIPRAELTKLEQKRLVPGMPADVYIRTQDRTFLSYLAKPIEDQMGKGVS